MQPFVPHDSKDETYVCHGDDEHGTDNIEEEIECAEIHLSSDVARLNAQELKASSSAHLPERIH